LAFHVTFLHHRSFVGNRRILVSFFTSFATILTYNLSTVHHIFLGKLGKITNSWPKVHIFSLGSWKRSQLLAQGTHIFLGKLQKITTPGPIDPTTKLYELSTTFSYT
jgi:hypothetical protein